VTDIRRRTETITDYLAGYDHALEVGIGHRTDVASALTERGVDVIATDIYPRPVPEGVTFIRDDVVSPTPSIYAGSEVIYALNLPPELHRPTLEVARRVDAAFCFTTLGGDQPAVSVERETIPGDTLYVARR